MRPVNPQFPEVNPKGRVDAVREVSMRTPSYKGATKQSSREENIREFDTRLWADFPINRLKEIAGRDVEVSGDALARLKRGQTPRYIQD